MTKNFKFTIIVNTDMDEPEAWDKLAELIEYRSSYIDIFDVERIEDD